MPNPPQEDAKKDKNPTTEGIRDPITWPQAIVVGLVTGAGAGAGFAAASALIQAVT